MFALVGRRGLWFFERWIASESTPKLRRADRWSAKYCRRQPGAGAVSRRLALTDLIGGQVQVVFLPPAIARLKPTS